MGEGILSYSNQWNHHGGYSSICLGVSMIKGSDIPPPASKLASFPLSLIINNSFVTSCQTSNCQL